MQVALHCPVCGEFLELDDEREKAFCQNCGQNLILKYCKTTSLDGTAEDQLPTPPVNNLLARAQEYAAAHNLDKAIEYCDRVIDVDLDNQEARELKAKFENTIDEDNVEIMYYLGPKLNLFVDGALSKDIRPCEEPYTLRLERGEHEIAASTSMIGGARNPLRIKIDSRTTRYLVEIKREPGLSSKVQMREKKTHK